MDNQKRKGYSNNKHFYNKRSKPHSLDVGAAGFLCTCNFREKECVRDAYKILEEFAIELYGPVGKNLEETKPTVETTEEKEEKESAKDAADTDDKDEDIADALNKELAELKAEAKKPASAKRFQNMDTGVKNLIFISTTVPNPLELAMMIFKKLDETKQPITRFVLRLVPIQIVCKANLPDIKEQADKLFEKYFAQEPKTFSIVFNRHCNNKIQRADIIEELAGLISSKNPGNRADLSNPEIAIVVEIVRGFCLLSIAPDYFKYKKYNLLELGNVKELEKSQEKEDEAANDSKETPEGDGATKETADSVTVEDAEPEAENEQVGDA